MDWEMDVHFFFKTQNSDIFKLYCRLNIFTFDNYIPIKLITSQALFIELDSNI